MALTLNFHVPVCNIINGTVISRFFFHYWSLLYPRIVQYPHDARKRTICERGKDTAHDND